MKNFKWAACKRHIQLAIDSVLDDHNRATVQIIKLTESSTFYRCINRHAPAEYLIFEITPESTD